MKLTEREKGLMFAAAFVTAVILSALFGAPSGDLAAWYGAG